MVALQGPQNHKMVASQRPKFARKTLFGENFAARSALPSILSFRLLSYIRFDHKCHQNSNFPHFLKNLEKWPNLIFFEIFEIATCFSYLNYLPRRKLDPFLGFLEPLLSDAKAKTPKGWRRLWNLWKLQAFDDL